MAALDYVKVGQQLTAKILNGIIGQVNGQALTGVRPGTLTSGGGTVTASASGKISFAGVSSILVGGVFTTDFDNYRLVWNTPTRSAAESIQFRFASGGVVYTGASYVWVRGQDQGTARSVTSGTAATAFPLDSPIAATQRSDGYADVWGPALGSGSSVSASAVIHDAATGLTQVQASGREAAAAAFDGFTLFVNSGTINGNLRIYGYNNLG